MKPTPDFGNGVQAEKDFVGSNVEPLPVIEVHGGHLSCWEVTPEQLEQIRQTGRVYLWVGGTEHPPVGLITEPFPAPGREPEESN